MEEKQKIDTPDWVKNAIFYQIFPDRFARSVENENNFPALKFEKWHDPPTSHGYKGGNLWGVIERLDYLASLGVTAIYFNPIFQSASNHRYHTHDYFQVDPILGGDAAFEELIDFSHRRGIHIVLDGVFNHAGRGFLFFNDIVENGIKSPWIDWFKVKKFPLSPYDHEKPANYECWEDMPALPQFNHENPAVREYLISVGEHWVNKGIDGWRLDVPNCIKTEGFWQDFRTRIKKINPDVYLVGEIWGEADEWLDGSKFDGVMNYVLTWAIIKFVGDENVDTDLLSRHLLPYRSIDAPVFAQELEDLFAKYPWEIQLTQLNLLSSHDMARFLSIVKKDDIALELASTIMFTLPGAPCIYYGDEIGMTGGKDPDCRRAFPSEKKEWNQSIHAHFKSLVHLRRNHLALSRGFFKTICADKKVLVFSRVYLHEKIVVALNVGDTQEEKVVECGELLCNSVTKGGFLVYFEKRMARLTILDDKAHIKISLPGKSIIVAGLM
ncbi:MAG: glycoside hydrolase family 13 protein [Oligoflexales bacterium]|nr:glycoside hydrolase family 13 protein [Oligoflexales bacterium]